MNLLVWICDVPLVFLANSEHYVGLTFAALLSGTQVYTPATFSLQLHFTHDKCHLIHKSIRSHLYQSMIIQALPTLKNLR